MLRVRDRKDPRKKSGNLQRIPLLNVSGYDACALLDEQHTATGKAVGRIFPWSSAALMSSAIIWRISLMPHFRCVR